MDREVHGKGEASHDDVMGHDFDDTISLVSNLSFVQYFFWGFLQRSSLRIIFPFSGSNFGVSIYSRAIYRISFVLEISWFIL